MKFITINYDVVLIVLSSFILLIAARDIIVRKDKKWHKRISVAGWLLIFAAILSGYITWKKIEVDKLAKDHATEEAKKIHDADKKDILKDVDEAFKKHSASFNPVTKTIIDTVKIIDKTKSIVDDPLIFICNTTVSDRKLGETFDTVRYSIAFCNQGEQDITNVNIKGYVYVPILHEQQKEHLDMFKNALIPKGVDVYYSNISLFKPHSIMDTSYIYITGNYNKGKKEINQILVIDGKSNKMVSAGVNMYDKIKAKMKELKIIK